MIYIYLTYPLLLLVEIEKGGKIILYGGVGKIYYRLEYFDWPRLRLGFLVIVCLFIFFPMKFSGLALLWKSFSVASFLLVFGFILSWFWLELGLDLVWLVGALLQLQSITSKLQVGVLHFVFLVSMTSPCMLVSALFWVLG